MFNRNTLPKLGIAAVLLLASYYAVYRVAETSAKRVTWLSELLLRTQGSAGYLINVNVMCANGKILGPLQVDLNLTNGKLRVVRNDAGTLPSCELPPQPAPQLPQPQPPAVKAPLAPAPPAKPEPPKK